MFRGREGAPLLIGGLAAIGSGRAVEGAVEAAAAASNDDPSDLTATFALPYLACPRPPPPPASQPASQQ